ncbi:hypothetical protein [Deinococcus multiflagellatus]|uniref:Uncharacterized protein n=1 Tax=Deinococcus multiflagellatus TaxID=1656887 RepID=A0ABW1ZJY4_9DEIO|nr:hypothetical protein [Deinococcus multiflagellatus]MBZ9716038.1 hypothetical protein [Deinococcus multiflagellatus]
MDFSAASFFLDVVVALQNYLPRTQPADRRIILEKFERALIETEIYIKKIERASGEDDHMNAKKEHRDYEKEADLARYWRAAAISARSIERSLDSLAYQKSLFWLDRDNWTRAQVNRNGIAISDARATIQAMKIQ